MKDKWIELGLFALILVILAVILNFRQIDVYKRQHIQRVKSNSPDTGNVRILSITEKQFEDMLLIVGTAIPTGREVDKKFTLVIE